MPLSQDSLSPAQITPVDHAERTLAGAVAPEPPANAARLFV